MTELVKPSFTPKGTFQFPRGTQLLVIGPPGITKTTLVIRYLADRLKQKEPAIYMTTLWTPEQIRNTFGDYIKSQKNSKIRVVDGVSCVTAKHSKESFALQNLYDLNTINLVLLQAIADIEKGHLCIDSLTTLMTYSAPVSVIKFLQVLCARVKNHNVTGLYLLEEGVHEKELVTTIRYIVDGVIEIRDQESTGSIMHQVRFAHVRGVRNDTRWLIFHKDEPMKFFTP